MVERDTRHQVRTLSADLHRVTRLQFGQSTGPGFEFSLNASSTHQYKRFLRIRFPGNTVSGRTGWRRGRNTLRSGNQVFTIRHLRTSVTHIRKSVRLCGSHCIGLSQLNDYDCLAHAADRQFRFFDLELVVATR